MFTAHTSLRTSILSCAALLGTCLATAPAHAQEPPTPQSGTTVIRVETPPAPSAPPQVIYVPVRTTSAGEVADWEDGSPVPYGYRPVKRARKGLVIAGAVTFGSVYLTTALAGGIASDSGGRGTGTLLVPVLGPLFMLGYQESVTGGFLLVLNMLAQSAGVTMFAVGLAMPRTTLARVSVGKVDITPVPMTFGPSSAGLGFAGKF